MPGTTSRGGAWMLSGRVVTRRRNPRHGGSSIFSSSRVLLTCFFPDLFDEAPLGALIPSYSISKSRITLKPQAIELRRVRLVRIMHTIAMDSRWISSSSPRTTSTRQYKR